MYVASEKLLSYVLSERLYNLILSPLYALTHTHIHTYMHTHIKFAFSENTEPER